MKKKFLYAGLVAILVPVAMIWVIAGSDRLFQRTVPLEQRLVSHNESIRKRAQQDLLGLSAEAKHETAGRLAPMLEQQEDPFLRKWVAIALALIGPSAHEAIPALLRGVSAQQSDVAQACRVALSEIGIPPAEQLPALLESLRSPQEAVRCEAASSIARMGPAAEPGLPALLLEIQRGAPVSECFIEATAGLLPSIPQAAEKIIALLKDPNAAVRRNAAKVLASAGPRSPAIIQAFLEILGEETDREVRQVAAKGLELRLTPEAGKISSLLYVLRRGKTGAVREEAMELLRLAKPSLDLMEPVLVHALGDEDARIRLAATRWLRDLDEGARPAIPALLESLKDPDLQVRQTALEALRRTGVRRREAFAPIARAQRDPDPVVRCLAAEQLVEMGAYDRVAVPLLLNDLRSEAEVSRCAAEALAQAGHFNTEVVPGLIRLLREKDRGPRSRAALVLLQLGTQAREALPALADAQRDHVPGAENAVRAIRESLPRPARSRRARR